MKHLCFLVVLLLVFDIERAQPTPELIFQQGFAAHGRGAPATTGGRVIAAQ
jgi:hypothetical protein